MLKNRVRLETHIELYIDYLDNLIDHLFNRGKGIKGTLDYDIKDILRMSFFADELTDLDDCKISNYNNYEQISKLNKLKDYLELEELNFDDDLFLEQVISGYFLDPKGNNFHNEDWNLWFEIAYVVVSSFTSFNILVVCCIEVSFNVASA